MEFEQQKPITDEYRKGWERIYAQQEERKAMIPYTIHGRIAPCPSQAVQYSNGCPILSEGPQKDDL